jgi:hypothetical protein
MPPRRKLIASARKWAFLFDHLICEITMPQQYVWVKAVYRRRLPNSLLIFVDGEDKILPLSQIEEGERFRTEELGIGEEFEVCVTKWIADKLSLEYEDE